MTIKCVYIKLFLIFFAIILKKNFKGCCMAFKLLVSCLEASANLHLRPILDELGEYELSGIFDESFGDPYMKSSDFSVMGFIDVVGKIPQAKRAIKDMADMSKGVDGVLLIDSPAFNLPLSKQIRKVNPKAKITYYILPQVWAWKPKRVKKVEALCDNLASILPFEQNFYSKATFVGHPLLDELKVQKQSLSHGGIVAFLAGSRKSEIKKLMPIFRKVAKQIDAKPLLVVPSFFKGRDLESIYGDIGDFELSFSTEDALLKSDFAFVCSGTATLEASLIGTPFVLVYKAKSVDYFIAKRFVKLKHVGLANIIFDFESLPPLHHELLQDEVNEKNLLDLYENFDRQEFLDNSKKLRQILKHGSAKEVSKMILI